MNTLVIIVVTVPIVAAVLAALLSQQVDIPGPAWTVVVTTVSIYFTTFGALLTYEAHKLSQQIQNMTEKKEQKRRDALIEYEIPHILHSLKMIKLRMYQTVVLLEKHTINGVIQTAEGAEYLHKRAITHAEAIRTLGTTFFNVELSKYHKFLDSALMGIDEIVFVSQNDTVDISKFKESLYVISRMIRLISTEYGVEPQETENTGHEDA